VISDEMPKISNDRRALNPATMSKSKNLASQQKDSQKSQERKRRFTFIAGNCRDRCPWIIADFLSPRFANFTRLIARFAKFRLKLETRNRYLNLFLISVLGIRLKSEIRTGACSFRFVANSGINKFATRSLAAISRRRTLLKA
jgi:hypothetical protein